MIENIQIRNYKNLSDITISGFERVNLISGKNNVGKSSLIEALALSVSERTLINILENRGEVPRFYSQRDTTKQEFIKMNVAAIASLFKNRNSNVSEENQIEIITNLGKLNLKFVYYSETENEDGSIKRIIFSKWDENDYVIDESSIALEILRDSEKRLLPLDRRLRIISNNCFLNFESIISIDANVEAKTDFYPKLWDDITLTEKEKYVIEALQIIEPKIENLAFLEGERYRERYPVVKLTGINMRYPLKSMGDGINHILSIALALVNSENGCLLIDEVDNGLHYSVQKKLWEIVFYLAKKLNVQVFATTHSTDCISSFGKVLAEEENFECGRYYRLEMKNSIVKAVNYNADELAIVAAQNIEIR